MGSSIGKLSHNIGDFTGLEVAVEAKVWLKQLEYTATLHRWTEAVAFETARAHLKKAARNWYLRRTDSISDWKTFRSEFKGTFLKEKSMAEKWKSMEQRSQRLGENTCEYFFDKVRLCKDLGI